MSFLLGFFHDARDLMSWARLASEVLAPLAVAVCVLVCMARRIYRLTKAGLHFNRVRSSAVFYKRAFLFAWGFLLAAEIVYCGLDEPLIPYREKELVLFPEYSPVTRA